MLYLKYNIWVLITFSFGGMESSASGIADSEPAFANPSSQEQAHNRIISCWGSV